MKFLSTRNFTFNKYSNVNSTINLILSLTSKQSIVFISLILLGINLNLNKTQVYGAQSTDELDNGFVVTEETHDWNYHHGSENTSITYEYLTTPRYYGFLNQKNQYSMDDIKFWGCYEYYSGSSSGYGNDTAVPEEYANEINPDTCMTGCKTKTPATRNSEPTSQVIMIKGNLCMCSQWKHWIEFSKTRLKDSYCNFHCQGTNAYLSSLERAECGGNIAVSIYCLKQDKNCEQENRDKIDTSHGAFDTSFDDGYNESTDEDVEEEKSPVQICLNCTRSELGCNTPSGFSKSQDYFPLNNPRACIANCRRMSTATQNYTVALLGWNYAGLEPGLKLPICACKTETRVNDWFKIVDDSNCITSCPGNNNTNCGTKETERLSFYNAHFFNSTFLEFDDDDLYNDNEPGSSLPTTEASSSPSPSTSPDPTTNTVEKTTTDSLPETSTENNNKPIPGSSTESVRTTEDTTEATTVTSAESPTSNCVNRCNATDLFQTWSGCPGLIVGTCPVGTKGNATWLCKEGGIFNGSHANYTGCWSQWFDNMKEEIFNKTNGGALLPKEDSAGYLDEMKKNCRVSNTNKKPYMGHEISSIASLTWQIVNHTKFESLKEGEKILQKALELPGILLSNSEPWNDLHDIFSKAVIGSEIVSTIEKSTLTLYKAAKSGKYNFNFNPSGLSPELENVVTFGTGGYSLATSEELKFPLYANSKSTHIILDSGWETLVNEAAFVGISISSKYIKNVFSPELISWKKKSDSSVGSIINSNLISLKIGVQNFSSDSKYLNGKKARIRLQHTIEAWGDKSQTILRKLHEGETPKVAMGSSVCVFWNVKNDMWSHDGCKIVATTRTYTDCECDHLTSFAVIMDPHNYVSKDVALEILTFILCPISVVCLLMSIIIFSTVGAIQCQRTTITKHLCFCLMIGIILILFLVDRNYIKLPDSVCVGVGIVTHYVYLAAFVWMAIEGVHLYKMVVYVFDSGRSPTTIYRVMAYGIPVLIVAVTYVVGYLLGDRPYGGEAFCWLEGNYTWSFTAPVALVVMGNMIILFVALKTAYQMKVATELLQARQRTYKNWIRGSFSITVLLGITWLPGFVLSTNPIAAKVAGYLFVILNSSQGIFLFIFHCFMNEKVRIVAERNLSLPTWLSMPSSHSREPTQSGKRSDNMKAYYSETMKSIKPDPDSLSQSRFREPKAHDASNGQQNGNQHQQNVGRTVSNDSNFSVFSIDYPNPSRRQSELRESDSGLSTSSQKQLVRGKRSSYYR